MDKDSRKNKILFVITKSNFGGAQKYVYDLATNLPKDKFEVAVVVGRAGILTDKLREQGIHVINIFSLTRDVSLLKDFKSFVELWRIFRAERPNIIHLNSAKASGLGALAARLCCISLRPKTYHLTPTIIFTAHGWAFNEDRPYMARFFIKIISWITVLLCHKTIAVSDSISRNMRWVGAQQKITVINIRNRSICKTCSRKQKSLLCYFG
ncbi:MAG: glycosyltransferase [Candidatus Yonathbacteria bacterium]|nr:glycosyltransferase [Candidatus Yonathbacteria bacterium]